jgi:hypothetical protein
MKSTENTLAQENIRFQLSWFPGEMLGFGRGHLKIKLYYIKDTAKKSLL